MATEQPSAQSSGTCEVIIDRWALYRALDIPGLARIDMAPKVAILTFRTAPGCEPSGLEFVAGEVQRITGGHAIEAREVGHAA